MEKVLEMLMAASFCVGLTFLIINQFKRKSRGTYVERFTTISMGLGFVAGTIWKITQGADLLAVLYGIGTALSCISAVLAFYKHKESREGINE